MFGHKQKKSGKGLQWLKGVLFGGIITAVLAYLFEPKGGFQLRRRFLRVKDSGTKQGKTLFRHSKQHTKAFAKQTKLLARNLSKEIKAFTKSIINESKE